VIPYVAPEWLTSLGLLGAGGIVYRVAQVALQWRRQSADEMASRSAAGLEIKKHRDRLTIDMLELARAELSAARSEIKDLRVDLDARDGELLRLRRIEWRLSAYEEAIEHIEALLIADQVGSREAAEHAAKGFLARMEAMKQLVGDAANAEQVARAGRRFIEGKDGA
jgi:hypothetical protein